MARTPADIYDELLVLRSQDGDARAFQELASRWQHRLWRHARRLTGSPDAAQDTTQDVWMSIVRGLGRLDDPSKFRAWAHRIVRNKSADWVRRQQRSRSLAQGAGRDAAARTPATGSSSADCDTGDVREALRRLTASQREIIELRHLEELSVAEIATVLSIPPGTVKSRLHHARNELRTILEGDSHERAR